MNEEYMAHSQLICDLEWEEFHLLKSCCINQNKIKIVNFL